MKENGKCYIEHIAQGSVYVAAFARAADFVNTELGRHEGTI